MGWLSTANRGERVRRRAYEIWEAEGRPDGKDFDHWARAELDVAAQEASDQSARGTSRADAGAGRQ